MFNQPYVKMYLGTLTCTPNKIGPTWRTSNGPATHYNTMKYIHVYADMKSEVFPSIMSMVAKAIQHIANCFRGIHQT